MCTSISLPPFPPYCSEPKVVCYTGPGPFVEYNIAGYMSTPFHPKKGRDHALR